MLFDNGVFEEPFEPVQLSKNAICPFEGSPNDTRINGLGNSITIPLLDAPCNLLDNLDPAQVNARFRKAILKPTISDTSDEFEPNDSPDSTPSPTFDPWLEVQNDDRRISLPTNSNSWETFALDAASTLKMKSKPQAASPFLSELSLTHFQRVEESYRQSKGLHYMPESLIKHPYLIKDVIQLLLGTPSNLFEYNSAKKSFASRIPNLRTMGIGSQGLSSVLDRFISIGNNMKKLDEIISASKFSSRSSVTMSFVNCLMDYHVYLQKSLLAMVERLGGTEKITVIELHHSVDEIGYVLDQLVELCNMNEKQEFIDPEPNVNVLREALQLPCGSELLSLIYNKLMSLDTAQAGSAHLLKSLFATLLAKSSTPYFTIIHRWLGTPSNGRNGFGQDILLYDQSLQSIDPYHEFFVQATNCTDSAASSQRKQIGHWAVNQATGTPVAKIAAQDGDQYWYQSYQLNYSLRPCFISHELALDILETGKSLRLLKDLFPVDGPSLGDYISDFVVEHDSGSTLPQWEFIISNGRESERPKADKPAKSLLEDGHITSNIDEASTNNKGGVNMYRSKHVGDDSLILPSPKRLRHNAKLQSSSNLIPVVPEFILPDLQIPKSSPFIELLERVQSCEDFEIDVDERSAHIPPLDIITMKSVEQPLARLCRSLNASVMAYFFKDLHLLQYLQALRDYFTFGNGDFYTNVMEALFHSNTVEEQAGGLIAVGLPKSIHSKKWPPSSIELNIALKDVLISSSSSYGNPSLEGSATSIKKVPAGEYISFSVRESIDNDSNKLTNPQSLEAVDFLQLSYSPPYPLNIVITPTIIEKYNRVFSFLLRLLRVRVVVQSMHKLMQIRRNGSFRGNDAYLYIEPVRFQMAQFVDALHGYVFDAVIASNWKAYISHLNAMADEASGSSSNNGSRSKREIEMDLLTSSKLMMDLDSMRTYNEYFVEILLHQCMLKRKQQGILRIIESLLGSALALAAMISDFDAVCYDGREPTENEVRKMHRHCSKLQNRFHSQMKTLVTILASLQARDSGVIRFAVDQRRMSKVEAFTEYYEKVSAEDGAVNCYERLLLRLDFNGYYQSV